MTNSRMANDEFLFIRHSSFPFVSFVPFVVQTCLTFAP